MNREQEINKLGPCRALIVSVMLHGLVLVGLGIGISRGPAPEPEVMITYLVMPAVEASQALDTKNKVLKKTAVKLPALRKEETTPPVLPGQGPEPEGQVQQEHRETASKPAEEIVAALKKPVPVRNAQPEAVTEISSDQKSRLDENTIPAVPARATPGDMSLTDGDADKSPARNPPSVIHYPADTILAFAGGPIPPGMVVPGSLGPDLIEAAILSLPEPEYPILSRKRGEEGRVVLEVTISPQGAVRRAQVKTSSSYPRLDGAALKAIQCAAFAPATEYGVPVESTTKVAYRFRLENK